MARSWPQAFITPLYCCGSYVFSTWKEAFPEQSGVPRPTGQEFGFGVVIGDWGGGPYKPPPRHSTCPSPAQHSTPMLAMPNATVLSKKQLEK